MKLKMFGSYSVSSMFFWISIFSFFLCTVLFIATFCSNLLKAYTGLGSTVKIIFFFIPKIIFLYVLILVFKIFIHERIFTKKAVKYLYMFMIVNFIMVFLIVLSIEFEGFWAEDIVPIFPLIILGVFSGFLAAIFKQGFELQQENDLTI